MMGKRALWVAVVVWGVVVPSVGGASPLFELIGDTTGGGGHSARHTTSNASSASVYFNPAMITRARRGFETGTFVLYDDISITLNPRPAGLDVPTGIRGSNHEGTYTVEGRRTVQPTIDANSLPSEWLEEGCPAPECEPGFAARPRQGGSSSQEARVYQSFGSVQSLLDERLVLALYLVAPVGDFTTAHSFFVDEREQFFTNSLHPELYGDRLTAVSLAFGAATPITDRLSVGVSAGLALTTDTTAGTYVSDSDNQSNTLLLSTNVGVSARVAPHLGVFWEPIDGWTVSATAHSPQRFDLGTGFSAALPDGNEQFAQRPATHNYLPWIVGLGTEWRPVDNGDMTLDLTAGVTFSRWETYVNRQSEDPLQGYEWADVFAPTIGARIDLGQVRTYVDVGYHPSPVPEQTGRTNYVDNDRLATAAGVDVEFELAETTFRVGLNVQTHLLFSRDHTKREPPVNSVAYPDDDRFGAEHYPSLVIDEVPDDATDGGSLRGEALEGREGLQTNNPGYPGYSSNGFLLGGGISFAILY